MSEGPESPSLQQFVAMLREHTGNIVSADRYGFLADHRHLNRNGMVHGGMIMTFADHAIGLAARTVNRTNSQATVQLDTAFLSGVEEGEFDLYYLRPAD